jgi:hypothetical protein
MFVIAVAGVHHMRLHPAGQELRRAGDRMTKDNVIHLHGLEVMRRVHQGFPLLNAGGGNRKAQHIGGQPGGGQLKGGAGAGRRFVKKKCNRFAAKRRDFLDGTREESLKGNGGIQNEFNFFGSELRQPEEVLMSKFHRSLRSSCLRTRILSSSSISFKFTSITSSGWVLRTRPT